MEVFHLPYALPKYISFIVLGDNCCLLLLQDNRFKDRRWSEALFLHIFQVKEVAVQRMRQAGEHHVVGRTSVKMFCLIWVVVIHCLKAIKRTDTMKV